MMASDQISQCRDAPAQVLLVFGFAVTAVPLHWTDLGIRQNPSVDILTAGLTDDRNTDRSYGSVPDNVFAVASALPTRSIVRLRRCPVIVSSPSSTLWNENLRHVDHHAVAMRTRTPVAATVLIHLTPPTLSIRSARLPARSAHAQLAGLAFGLVVSCLRASAPPRLRASAPPRLRASAPPRLISSTRRQTPPDLSARRPSTHF
jgi:hypothetical protein